MKTMKRLGCILLVVAMCLALGVSAFATVNEGPFTITITNEDATADNYGSYEYTAYQIFSGVLDEETEGEDQNAHTVTYLTAIEWGSMFVANESTDPANPTPGSGDAFLAYLQENDDTNSFTSCESAEDVAEVLSSADSSVVTAFSNILAKWVESNSSVISAGTSTTNGVGSSGKYEYTISQLDPGYYIVLSTKVPAVSGEDYESAWTNPILQVVENVTVEAKSDIPTVKKEIVDNDDNQTGDGEPNVSYDGNDMTYSGVANNAGNEAIGDVGDYNIGTEIWFQLTATLPSADVYATYDTYELIFHDSESTGLTADTSSIKVYVDDGTGKLTEVREDCYSVLTNETTPSCDSACTFEVSISNTKTLVDSEDNPISVEAGTSTIVVQYKSVLNSDAVIGNGESWQSDPGTAGNYNEIYLEFSNKSYNDGTGKTRPDMVQGFTYQLVVNKEGDVDSGDEGTPLAGVQFVLYTYDANGTPYYYAGTGSNDLPVWVTSGGAYTGSGDNITWNSDCILTTELNADKTAATINVQGLDEGTYYLKEIETVGGYNMLEEDVEITIVPTYSWNDTYQCWYISDLTVKVLGDKNASASSTNTGDPSTGTVTVDIVNNHGSRLPSTGGIGTTIFYIVGAVLVCGAVVLLVTRKRVGKEEG